MKHRSDFGRSASAPPLTRLHSPPARTAVRTTDVSGEIDACATVLAAAPDHCERPPPPVGRCSLSLTAHSTDPHVGCSLSLVTASPPTPLAHALALSPAHPSAPAAMSSEEGVAAAAVASLPLSIGDLSTAERSAIYQYYVGIFVGLCVLLLLIRKVRR